MFASQAAVVIANSHRYTEEHRAKDYLEALVNTVPVGVSVFDAKTGDSCRSIRSRGGLSTVPRAGSQPGRNPQRVDLPASDGREIPLDQMPTIRALKNGETVRAEEIIIQLPDGQGDHHRRQRGPNSLRSGVRLCPSSPPCRT